MSSNNLPPVCHLPHWTRVGGLGKPCSPRRLPANRPQPLPAVPSATGASQRAAELPCDSDMGPRVASLQRNIQFLQQQHKETLERLHAEIEYLRRENKELQYKLIMEPPKSSRKGPTHSRRGVRPPTQGSEAHTGLYLEKQLQDTRPSQDQALSSPSHPPRAPTLQECEVIIRQLYNANSLQSQEIIRVKALLRDIVLSKKITTENYILTKAYLDDSTRKFSEGNKFPKLGLQTYPEKTSGPSQSGVVLPALKQSLSSTVAERQRRTRAVQRDRFKRMVK
ncbi:coiled-coil domain-containing protein 74B isoform X2 [Xiphias gladius]|uniref:coiled-coil domain-containing protein 74B isoform X2 n=1 Tax=Xiphias gladius TaxID=8245 RepID=UPI001A9A28BC|nr:coiled-coil domain-containing protein 74B isoform X2 [Xiphias gladius]